MNKHTSELWELEIARGSIHRVFHTFETTGAQCCGVWTRDQKYYVFDSWRDLEAGIPTAPASNIWVIRERKNLFHLTSQQPIQLTAGPVHFFTHAISSDSKNIFALSTQRRGELTRYDVKTGRFSPFLSGISADSVSFSRDGAWMAYVKYPQGELWRSRADGSQALKLTSRPLMAYGPQWSPDGTRIAFCGQKVGTMWQPFVISADGSTQQLQPETAEGTDPTWSPDGNLLLLGPPAGTKKGNLKVLNLRTKEVSVVPGSDGLGSPRWSPNGQYISAMSITGGRLMLFDYKTQNWTKQATMDEIWQNWSRDGRYIYFASLRPDPGIFRVAASNNRLTKIVSLAGFRQADPEGAWFSLDNKDEPLLLRDTGGGTEIYALRWDAP